MASNTPALGLYKKDPIADANDTFNIETMLNQNWDRIDNLAQFIKDEFELLEFRAFTSSQKVTFPEDIYETVYIILFGAGGGGAGCIYTHSGASIQVLAGGGSGEMIEAEVEIVPGNSYDLVIGAGGTKGAYVDLGSSLPTDSNSGKDGGTTTFLGYTANGGKGASCKNMTAGSGGSGGGINVYASYKSSGALFDPKTIKGGDGSYGGGGAVLFTAADIIITGAAIRAGNGGKYGGGGGATLLRNSSPIEVSNGMGGTFGGAGGTYRTTGTVEAEPGTPVDNTSSKFSEQFITASGKKTGTAQPGNPSICAGGGGGYGGDGGTGGGGGGYGCSGGQGNSNHASGGGGYGCNGDGSTSTQKNGGFGGGGCLTFGANGGSAYRSGFNYVATNGESGVALVFWKKKVG